MKLSRISSSNWRSSVRRLDSRAATPIDADLNNARAAHLLQLAEEQFDLLPQSCPEGECFSWGVRKLFSLLPKNFPVLAGRWFTEPAHSQQRWDAVLTGCSCV